MFKVLFAIWGECRKKLKTRYITFISHEYLKNKKSRFKGFHLYDVLKWWKSSEEYFDETILTVSKNFPNRGQLLLNTQS